MKKFKNTYGFTLIELLMYVGIFTIIAGLTTSILLTVTRVNQNESASVEVTGQLNFVMQRLQQLVRDSSNIEISSGVTTSTLKLRMKDPAKDPICLSLINNVIKLAEGPDTTNANNCTSTVSDLTSDRVIIDTFNLQKISQYPGHDTLSIDLQITYNSNNPQSRIQRTLQSAIARVSAATFDSNLVPGGSGFSLGEIGTPWQQIIMRSGDSYNPSYTFSNDTSLGMFGIGSALGFSTAGLERVRIDGNGNVGIGTVSVSSAKLTVQGGSEPDVVRFQSLTNNSGAVLDITTAATGANTFALRVNDDGTFTDSSPFVIDTSGNVGVGVTAPAAKLEVNGNVMIDSGGSANHAICWKADGKTLGYCSTVVSGTGTCTCN